MANSSGAMTGIVQRAKAKLAAFDLYAGEHFDIDILLSLHEVGVDIDYITNVAGPICHETVSFLEGGRFGYDALGTMAYIAVVLEEDAETELDIVAWSARQPEVFGVLLGHAALLGSDRVLNLASYCGGRPCPLWRTPLRWLQEQCEGAVVLQAIPASTTLAKASRKLAAEDENHARELVRSGAVRRDQVVFPRRARRVAA